MCIYLFVHMYPNSQIKYSYGCSVRFYRQHHHKIYFQKYTGKFIHLGLFLFLLQGLFSGKFYSLAGKSSCSLKNLAVLWKILFWKFFFLDGKLFFIGYGKDFVAKLILSLKNVFTIYWVYYINTDQYAFFIVTSKVTLFLLFKPKGTSFENQGIRKVISLSSLSKLTRSHKQTNKHLKISFWWKKLQGALCNLGTLHR